MTIRPAETYRWSRRREFKRLTQLFGPHENGWIGFNAIPPGANVYRIGSTPIIEQQDAEIDYGRSKYARAHSSKREALRRLAQMVRQ